MKQARFIDWWFVGAAVFLITLGLVMQYSIGLNQPTPDLGQFSRQFAFVAVGATAFVVLSIIDSRALQTHPFVHATLGLILLVAVLLFGTTIKGTTGWFVIAGFSFQPVEFLKLLFMLFMAAYYANDLHSIQKPKFFFTSGTIAAVFVGLILLQPDTGSALIIFAIWFAYIILLKAPKHFVALVVGVVAIATVLAWFFFFPDYQKARLTTFLNQDSAEIQLTTGYNLRQSIVAVGSGSWWGRGIGLGTQSQLHFLPEVSSDFIFAAVAEELGFVGVMVVIAAIGILLFQLWRYMMQTKDNFSLLFLIGVFSYILVQSTMVIGMNIGILPVTGVPLPLVSAGGSSMIATLCMLGIAHNIGRRSLS